MKKSLKALYDTVNRQLEVERQRPFVISIMGQTGVGKSSLINALFGTNLKTDPVRPCTKEIEKVVVSRENEHELWFYDLPGIGESDTADAHYLTQYKEKLFESDVVLWGISSENRAISFDRAALDSLLKSSTLEEQVELMSRLTFVLTKADLIAPPPWIFAKTKSDSGVFATVGETTQILEEKAKFCQETFLAPYGELIVSRTYNDGTFNVQHPAISYDEDSVSYKGILDEKILENLKLQTPNHSDTFDRLFDNYRVIPTSSAFRFNLSQLMLVIVNKLGEDATGRFKKFTGNTKLNTVPIKKVKQMCNLMVYDNLKGEVIFDFSKQNI